MRRPRMGAGVPVLLGMWLLLLALSGALAVPARACTVDGIASMTVDGFLTTGVNPQAPTAKTMAYWAPFTLDPVAAGTAVRLGEDLGKLRKALPSAAFERAFNWRFGDGGTAQGTSVSHSYTRPGWYKVSVSYYWPGPKRWVVFDSAQVRVLGPATTTHALPGSALGGQRTLLLGISSVVALGCLALLGQHMASRWHTR